MTFNNYIAKISLISFIIMLLILQSTTNNISGSDQSVDSVLVPNKIVEFNREQSISKLTDYRSIIGAQWLIDNGITGNGVRIGIIDSGVTNSTEFDDRFISAKSFVTIQNGYSKNELSLTDNYNHGTYVAQLALGSSFGIAPSSQLVSAKIFGDGSVLGNGDYVGEETTRAIIEAIYYLIEQNVSVINLSIGQYSNIINDGRQWIIDKVSKEHGIVFTIAAGNEGYGGIDGGTLGTPGTAFQAITVAATDSSGQLMMGFSSSGFRVDYTVKPDVSAPGTGGTSFAAPLIAGGVALLIQALKDNNLQLTAGAIKAALIESARPLDNYPVWYQGAGLINFTAAYEILMGATITDNVPNVVTAFPKKLPIIPLNNLFREQKLGLNLTIVSSNLVTGTASITGIPDNFLTYNKIQTYNQSSRLSIYFNPPKKAELKTYIGSLSLSFSNDLFISIDLEFTVKEALIKVLFDETKNGFVNEIKPKGISSSYSYFQDPWGDQAFLLGSFREFYHLLASNGISVTPFQNDQYTNLSYLDQFDILVFPHPFTKMNHTFSDWWNDPIYGDEFKLIEDTLYFSSEELTTIKSYLNLGLGSVMVLSSDPRHVNSTAINSFFDMMETGISLSNNNIKKEIVNTSGLSHKIFESITLIDYFGSSYSTITSKTNVNSYANGLFTTIDYGTNKGKMMISGSAYFAENYMLNSASSSNYQNNCNFVLNVLNWLKLNQSISETSISDTTSNESIPISSEYSSTNSGTTTKSKSTSISTTICEPSYSYTKTSEIETEISTSSTTTTNETTGFSIFSLFIVFMLCLVLIRRKR